MPNRHFMIKEGDRLPYLRATLINADQTPVPLGSGGIEATARLLVENQPLIGGPCVIEDAVNGIVRYEWDATDTAVPGTYRAEIEVTFNPGVTRTFPNDGYITIEVVPELG